MTLQTLNHALASGDVEHTGLFPHLDLLQHATVQFLVDFGLQALPEQPGILMIRGPRQYGKSTWLEQQLYNTIKQFGPGSAYYINGDYLLGKQDLESHIQQLLPFFNDKAPVNRLFIDEITAIDQWEVVLKRLVDSGQLRSILVVTTGSKATDLRRASEKLPGRKGKLERANYLFTPIAYVDFEKAAYERFQDKTVWAYLLTGGSPIACNELIDKGFIPEYVIELVRDWIEGEIAASGRSRHALHAIMQVLYRFGGSAIGQAKLAREAGLANNTVATGYMDILADLGCVLPSYAWDANRDALILRKPCKYHFTNLLAAIAYHPNRLRSVDDILALPSQEQSMWYEWLVAQELTRRQAIYENRILEPLAFWCSKQHEVDFVVSSDHFVEVKLSQTSPMAFTWFPQQLPNKQLQVIAHNSFDTPYVKAKPMEAWLKQED